MILFEAAPPLEIFHWPDHPTLLIKTMFLKSVVHEPPAPEFPVWKWGLLGGVCVCVCVCVCVHMCARKRETRGVCILACLFGFCFFVRTPVCKGSFTFGAVFLYYLQCPLPRVTS